MVSSPDLWLSVKGSGRGRIREQETVGAGVVFEVWIAADQGEIMCSSSLGVGIFMDSVCGFISSNSSCVVYGEVRLLVEREFTDGGEDCHRHDQKVRAGLNTNE